jgi:hypothetical protein
MKRYEVNSIITVVLWNLALFLFTASCQPGSRRGILLTTICSWMFRVVPDREGEE